MKVFAVGNFSAPPTAEVRDKILPKEVPHTLRLYLDGVIEQFWFRTDKPGVFFLMNVESVDQARSTIEAMPLAHAGILKFELSPVGPLAPLARLLPSE